MRKEDWESLQGNPGWSALRGYLFDWRAKLVDELAEGRAPYPESVHKAQMLRDLGNIEWKDIEKFYAPPQPAPRDDQ